MPPRRRLFPPFCTLCASHFPLMSPPSPRPVQVVRLKLVELGMISELFTYNIHRGCNESKNMARSILCALIKNDREASEALTMLIEEKVMFCLQHHNSMDVTTCIYNEMLLLIQTAMIQHDSCFNQRMGLVLRVFRKVIVWALGLGAGVHRK